MPHESARERDFLIKKDLKLCRLWKPHVITSKTVWLVVLWSALIHLATVYTTVHLILRLFDGVVAVNLALYINACQSICFLLYPVIALFAEVFWTRFAMMCLGIVVQLAGTVLITTLCLVVHFHPLTQHLWCTWLVLLLGLMAIQLGLAFNEANVIQFGTDQMPDASSVELSAFIHWYFCCAFIGHWLVSVLTLTMASRPLPYTQAEDYTLLSAFSIQLLLLVVQIMCIPFESKNFEIYRPEKNPCKIIFKVLTYALYNKNPNFNRRSSFSYDQNIPSRVDCAKMIYGGPFETEVVEDVKTFFRILFVIFSLFGFGLVDLTISTGRNLQQIANFTSEDLNLWDKFITSDTFGVSVFAMLAFVPTYQLIFKTFLYRYCPSMFKKLFIGLILAFLSVAVIQTLEIFITVFIEKDIGCERCQFFNPNSSCSWKLSNATDELAVFDYNLLVIPQIVNGLSFVLVFPTVFEFILAQAPRYMQGVLIGIWYSTLSLNLFISLAESEPEVNCRSWLPGAKGILMLVLIPVYLYTAKSYRRRIREDTATTNERLVIEQYTERGLIRRAEILN